MVVVDVGVTSRERWNEKSWSNVPLSNMGKKQFHRNTEWVVIYKNKEIKDQTKQTLYIFVNLYGKVTGANHTVK